MDLQAKTFILINTNTSYVGELLQLCIITHEAPITTKIQLITIQNQVSNH